MCLSSFQGSPSADESTPVVADGEVAGSPWTWLLDTARAVALLVGWCVGAMTGGAPPTGSELEAGRFLATGHLFSNGLCGHAANGGSFIAFFSFIIDLIHTCHPT